MKYYASKLWHVRLIIRTGNILFSNFRARQFEDECQAKDRGLADQGFLHYIIFVSVHYYYTLRHPTRIMVPLCGVPYNVQTTFWRQAAEYSVARGLRAMSSKGTMYVQWVNR